MAVIFFKSQLCPEVVSQYIVIARRRRWEGAMGGEMGGEMSGATPPATPAGRRPPAAVFVGPFSLRTYKLIDFFLSWHTLLLTFINK